MPLKFTKKFWIFSLLSFIVFLISSFLIRNFENTTASILMPQPTETIGSKSDEEWDKEYAQAREEGKKLCDEYQYPADLLNSWGEEVLQMFIICKNAEANKDYINVTYLLDEIKNPSSEYSPKIEYGKINGLNFAALMGISTSNYYLFYDEKPLADLAIDNGKRHNPSYRINSDGFGNQWFISTELGNSGSDLSEYIDSWYWIEKSKPELKKVLEYPSLGGFGTGWGIFNDDGWLGSDFSVKDNLKTVEGNSYVDFDFSRSYEFWGEELASNKISMRYRWDPTTKSFEYVSGDSGFGLKDIDGDNSPLFKTKTEKCDVNWILCMNAAFIKENYNQLMVIATESDISKKKALEGILVKNPSEETGAKEKQELIWFHNIAQVKKLLSKLN